MSSPEHFEQTTTVEQTNIENWALVKDIVNTLLTENGERRESGERHFLVHNWIAEDAQTKVRLVAWVPDGLDPEVTPYYKFGMAAYELIDGEELESQFSFSNDDRVSLDFAPDEPPEQRSEVINDYLRNILRYLRTHEDTARIETSRAFWKIIDEQDMVTSVLAFVAARDKEVLNLVQQYQDSISIEDYDALRQKITDICSRFSISPTLVDYVINRATAHLNDPSSLEEN